MFTFKPVCRCELRLALVSAITTRNKITAADPIQRLFIDKIIEYKRKSKGDLFVEPSEAILKELREQIEKLEKTFGGGKGIDMNEFPNFSFQEFVLDPIDEQPPKEKEEKKSTKGAGDK